jgi:hypothetical protein
VHAHSGIARVRWHARVCRMAASICPLSNSPPLQRRMDKCPSRRLHARPLPLRHRCCALLRSRAHPLYLCAGRIAPTQCVAIKDDLPHAFCSHPHRCLLPVSRHRCTASIFRRSVSAKPPLSPCVGARAPQGSRAAPRLAQVTSSLPLSSSVINRIGELHPLHRPPSSLRAGALDHARQVRCAPWVLTVQTLLWLMP